MDDSTAPYSQMFWGKRLLIVEDSYFLADEARQKLLELGATIVGPVDDMDAVELIEAGGADAAILDLHLATGRAFSLVERLERQGLPYVFALVREPSGAMADFTGFVLCEKSVAMEQIAKALFGNRKRDI
ncbi:MULTISPECIES: response regulator [unclassified Rhizobium]|uniref:response regulator n=1 Tax=unclassified Rhizobium TaxID=2613769 RepID=UPI000EAA19DE|nr:MULTISPECIES: response regulator [unclassified Rhizobium]AYG69194.1 response regulator [Rhizobium sp. CCGE531]AYG75574.1 response regulator [Rhizobium sp. CCGE532]